MKRDFTADFKDIMTMVNKIRSINESISFGEDYEDENDFMGQQGQSMDEPDEETAYGEQKLSKMEPQTAEEEIEAESQDPNSVVNQIRKIALQGMCKLCDNPQDPQYDVLKKIFALVDKANDKKNDEKNA